MSKSRVLEIHWGRSCKPMQQLSTDTSARMDVYISPGIMRVGARWCDGPQSSSIDHHTTSSRYGHPISSFSSRGNRSSVFSCTLPTLRNCVESSDPNSEVCALDYFTAAHHSEVPSCRSPQRRGAQRRLRRGRCLLSGYLSSAVSASKRRLSKCSPCSPA